MKPWRCPRCRREGQPEDARNHWEKGDRDQPGYWEDACRRCTKDPDEDEAARDHAADVRFNEMRESHLADGTGEP